MATTTRLGLRLFEATDVANHTLINDVLNALDAIAVKLDTLAATGGHVHSGTAGDGTKIPYANLTGVPSSLPASGGNADTVDSKHAADFALASHAHAGMATTAAFQAADGHAHTGVNGQGPKIAYANLTGVPSSLPASGGNADTVDSKHAADFSLAAHVHSAATTSVAGFLSAADKTSLNQVVERVNQSLTTSSSPTSNVVTAAKVIGAVYQ